MPVGCNSLQAWVGFCSAPSWGYRVPHSGLTLSTCCSSSFSSLLSLLQTASHEWKKISGNDEKIKALVTQEEFVGIWVGIWVVLFYLIFFFFFLMTKNCRCKSPTEWRKGTVGIWSKTSIIPWALGQHAHTEKKLFTVCSVREYPGGQ